jgi:hypothetical protein
VKAQVLSESHIRQTNKPVEQKCKQKAYMLNSPGNSPITCSTLDPAFTSIVTSVGNCGPPSRNPTVTLLSTSLPFTKKFTCGGVIRHAELLTISFRPTYNRCKKTQYVFLHHDMFLMCREPLQSDLSFTTLTCKSTWNHYILTLKECRVKANTLPGSLLKNATLGILCVFSQSHI